MPVKVLMVCLGNICRSPLAEGILDTITDSEVLVDSAGTAGYHVGNPPDPRSISVAAANGIDISGQRCRQFRQEDFDYFDYILAMDRENLQVIKGLARDAADLEKVFLLLEAGNMGEMEVPDPYYGGADGFQKVFSLIQNACQNLSEALSP